MCFDSLTLVLIAVVVLAILILYYVLLTRAILQMLRRDTNTVLLIFSFLALLPVPPTLIMGVLVMIIWKLHKKTLSESA